MGRARGSRSQVATGFEAAYGGGGAGFMLMPFARENVGKSQPLLANELLGYGRDPIAPVKDVTTVDGNVTVPIDPEAFGFWLKATFGDPTTTEDNGVYTHVFTSGSFDLPSFAYEKGLLDVPHFEMVTGCMVESMSWQMQRGGHLTADLGLKAQNSVTGGATGAGGAGEYQVSRFGQFNGSVKRNNVVLGSCTSASLNYKNNLDPVESIGNDGLVAGFDPAVAEFTGSVTQRFDNQQLLNDATSGVPVELEFALVKSASQSLTVTAHEVYLPVPKVPIEGPKGVQVTSEWQAARRVDGGPMVTLTLINGIASY